MHTFKRFHAICATRVHRVLHEFLQFRDSDNPLFHRWQEALQYSTAGGKRIRAMLSIAAGTLYAVPEAELDIYAAALELIHAYSLVHDDLPAMDNDFLRRGKPTTHAAFGEADAILVGDALNTGAFELLAGSITPSFNSLKRIKMIACLAQAAGFKGMGAGQYLDIHPEASEANLKALQELHQLKTGKLIEAAVKLPLIYAEANPEESSALLNFAAKFGIIFQIQDDILDVEGNAIALGKTPAKDALLQKLTYPAVLGLAETKKHRDQLYEEAVALISPFGKRADLLLLLLKFARDRNY